MIVAGSKDAKIKIWECEQESVCEILNELHDDNSGNV